MRIRPCRTEASRFDHVTFRYSKTSAKPVLSDIDLSIKSGETIGIIGGTGSSKSSLVNLISRLYDVSEGACSRRRKRRPFLRS